MGEIACIGWGSLTWERNGLPIKGEWREDGPVLPVEFARQSKDGRLTLVLVEGVPPVQTSWIPLRVESLDAAVEALCKREGTSTTYIGCWPGASADNVAKVIGRWGESKQLSGAVWTALPSKWNGTNGRAPSLNEALGYLTNLTDEKRQVAEKYIRRAPNYVRTPFREAFERELGWLPAKA